MSIKELYLKSVECPVCKSLGRTLKPLFDQKEGGLELVTSKHTLQKFDIDDPGNFVIAGGLHFESSYKLCKKCGFTQMFNVTLLTE